jgi:hypothetical protein
VIDVGELNGRLFVNLAGLGFDAHVAARFASLHRTRRGFLRYALIVFQELRRYQGAGYEMSCDGDQASTHHAFLISFANGRQWGNGAIIPPDAAIDDGYLDVVVVSAQTKATVLRALPRLFSGTVDRAPGVRFDAWNVRESRASARFWAMSMVRRLHVGTWLTFAFGRKRSASACDGALRYSFAKALQRINTAGRARPIKNASAWPNKASARDV